MSDRRPARARKKVDYTKFGGSDDFDDDFADSTPPPSKKPKISSDKALKKKVTANQEKMKSTKRAPLVEKVYERELQAALELSLIESQSSNCDDDEDFKPQNNKKSSVIKLDKEKLNNTELTCSDKITEVKNVLCTVKVNEENKTNVINKERQIIQSVDYNTKDTGNTIQNLQENTISKTVDGNDSDGIVVLDEDDNVGRGGRRRSIPKAKVIDDNEDNDSEFGLDEDDDTDEYEEYDNENDSDFNSGSKNREKASSRKSSTPKPKKQIKTKATIKTAASTKGPLSVTGRHVDKSPAVTVKPMCKSLASKPVVTSPIVRTVQKWNPPGSAGNVKSPLVGTSIKSPSSGLSIKSPGMRVGLSRNQRVRSLHPGLTLKTT